MTEAEWLTCENYRTLENTLWRTGNERRGFLMACACCRLVWHLLPAHCHQLIETVENYAEDQKSLDEVRIRFFGYYPSQVALATLAGGEQAAEAIGQLGWQWRWEKLSSYDIWYIISRVSRSVAEALAKTVTWQQARQHEIHIIRDIFGNPFRPVVFDPEWRTSTAVALAQQMYESRDFSPMPILADALQDAGCDNADILNHCREPNGVHVRGCWVVDLVLGKS